MNLKTNRSFQAAIAFFILSAVAIIGISIVYNTDSFGYDKSKLIIHYIDVGQADCILLESKGKNMLIDAGNAQASEIIKKYLKKRKIKKIDILILTHSHEDHIGAVPELLEDFPITDKIYFQRDGYESKAYERMEQALEKKGYQVTEPKSGELLQFGDCRGQFFVPSETYEEENNQSLVLQLVHGNNRFLFTGDMEEKEEKELLQSKLLLSADVLKVGHHGSSTSSSIPFLTSVKPTYAVISCGLDNPYGHPHSSVLRYLKQMGTIVYRTDQMGTIRAISNGEWIKFESR